MENQIRYSLNTTPDYSNPAMNGIDDTRMLSPQLPVDECIKTAAYPIVILSFGVLGMGG